MADEVQTEDVLARSTRRAPGGLEFIRHQIEGPVARLTLHRPEHNLLNEQMLRELADAIGMVAEHGGVKLIILDAAGKVFSAGVDIREYIGERAFSMLDAFYAACIAMVEAPRPVLVIVDGAAIGGGAELVSYGDLVVATPRARFALPEITIGMFPPLASTMFPHIVGPKRALELVLTGEAISAERAREAWCECAMGASCRNRADGAVETAVSNDSAASAAAAGACAADCVCGGSWRCGSGGD